MKAFLLTACIVLAAIGIAKIVHGLLAIYHEKKHSTNGERKE